MLNALTFEIGIKEAKNSELDSIITRLNQLSGKSVTIDVKGVPELNQLLNRLGHDGNGISFKLPDLSTFLEQLKTARNSADGLFAKQNAQDIPAFQTALSQLKELSAAIEKLKAENLSLQSGHGSDIFNRIQKMGTALNSAFSEVPNVKIQSMTGYMKELTAEYMKFIASIEKKGGIEKFSANAQSEIRRVVDAYKQLNDVGSDSSNLKIFQQQVRAVASILLESLGNVVSSINAVKTAIQHDNFSAMSDRINNASNAIAKLDENFKKFHLTIAQDAGMKDFMTGLGEVIRNVRTSMAQLEGSRSGVGLTDFIKSMERAKYEAYQLDNLLQRATTAAAGGAKYGDTKAIEAQIEKVRQYRTEIEILKNTGVFNGMTTSEYKLQGNYKIAVDQLKKMVAETERAIAVNLKLDAAALKASHGINQLATEEQKLAQSIVASTTEMFGQSQILSELKTMATQYLGVWGAQEFMRNIIQVGGQLEMQRLSIAAILGDTAQANDLFEKIKGMAIQSPFGVVELDQMTKQLTAYGFQYHELFDMTKRLADISAATGTDVSRLALALGHVRSESALSGYTLRQFAMANIPMAQKLSDLLSEIEGKYVSVAEVRKRVRKKEISYEDVQTVLKDLTNEGGMFYNSQEVISGSVKAKYKNLHDAMDIMYGEMAESKLGDALKEVARILTSLTREWEKLGAAITVVAGMWAIRKGASFLDANAMLAYGSSLTKLKMNIGSLTAEEMRELAYSNQLTKQRFLEAVATGKVSVEDAKLAAAKWNLTEAQLQEIANGQRTVASMTANSIATSKYSMAQLRAIASMRTFTLGNKTAALWLNVVTTNAKMAGAAMLGFLKAALPVALITAGAEAWMHYKQQGEQAAEAAANAFRKGEESVRNIREALEKLPKFEIVNGVANLDEGALRNGLKEAVKELKNYNPAIANDIIKEANKVDAAGKSVMNLAQQYAFLRSKVEETRLEMEEYQRTSVAQETALKNTGGFLDDNVFGDINDYFNARKDFVNETNSFYAEYGAQVRTAIDAARAEDEAYRKRTEGMTNYAEMLRVLVTESGQYWDAYQKFWNSPQMQTEDFKTMWDGVLGHGGEMKRELDNWAEGLQSTLAGTFGYDFSHLTQEQFNNVRRHIWEFTNSEELGTLDDETRKWIRNYLGTKWNITFSADTEQALKEFDEMQEHIEQLVGKPWVIKLKLQSVDTYEGLYDQLNKNVKEAKEAMKKIGTGISKDRKQLLESGSVDDTKLTPKEREYRDNYLTFKSSKEAAEKEGFVLDALKDKNKGGTKGEDKYAKAVRERVRIMKEAADAYQYWRNKVGDKAAWNHVLAEFGEVLEEIGVTADNVDDLRKNLKGLDPIIKSVKDPKVRNETRKERDKELAQLDRKDFEKSSDEYASKIKAELDNMTRAWETFTNLRDITGNVTIAVKLSGAQRELGKAENFADALKEKIQDELYTLGAITIPFDVNFSDKDIENKVRDAFAAASPEQVEGESGEAYQKRLKEYESQIAGVIEQTKKWRDLQKELQTNAIVTYANLLTDADSMRDKLRTINTEYEKQIKHLKTLKRLGKISQEDYDAVASKANRQRKLDSVSTLVNDVDWGQTSMLYGKIFSAAGDELGKKLKEYIGSEDFNKLDVTQQRQYLDLQKKLNESNGKVSNPFSSNTWADLGDKTKALQKAVGELINDTFDLLDAKDREKKASEELVKAKGTEAEKDAQENYDNAVQNRVDAENKVTQSQKKVQQANEDREESEERAKNGLEGFGTALSEITSGSLSSFILGIGNLIESLSGDELSGGVEQLLSNLGVGDLWSGIIAAIISILDNLEDDAPGFFKELLDSIFGAVTGIIRTFLNGELLEAIVESAVEGVGHIIEAIIEEVPSIVGDIFNGNMFEGKGLIGGIFGGLVKGIGNIFYDNDTRDEVDAAIATSNSILDGIKDIVSEIRDKMKESFGAEAIDKYDEAIHQYRLMMGQYHDQVINAGWGKYGNRHSEWYYRNENGGEGEGGYVDRIRRLFGLEQLGYGTAWQGLFDQLATMGDRGAEILAELRYNANTIGGEWAELWFQINNTGWDDEGRISKAANAWADLSGMMKETTKEFREQIAGTSFDTVFDEFMNGLYEVANGSKYAFDDIANNWKKMINKMIVNNLVGAKLKRDLQAWYDNVFSPWYLNTGGSGDTKGILSGIEELKDKYIGEVNALRNMLFDVSDDSGSSLSSSIKGIQEQTADVLAAYVNAIRADVAIDRMLLTKFVNEYWNAYVTQITGIKTTLDNIDQNVAAIHQLMSENGALYNLIESIDTHLKHYADGFEQIHIA